jgi:hypothetical protein
MTHEEISEYRINLRERVRANEIVFDIKTNSKEFPDSRITKVFERIGKTSRLNLIAILVDLDYLNQNEQDFLKDDGKTQIIEKKKNNFSPEGFRPFYSEDIKENIERAKQMRKLND